MTSLSFRLPTSVPPRVETVWPSFVKRSVQLVDPANPRVPRDPVKTPTDAAKAPPAEKTKIAAAQ